MPWIERWLHRPVAVISWAAALVIGGVWAAVQVPVEWVPTVELPEVRIHASWPGASPRTVERYVTAPIERTIQNVPGTETVESLSQEGTSTVTLGVSSSADLGPYVAEVSEQLALLRDVLPDRVQPRLTKQVPEALRNEQGFMTLQLVGPGSPDALRVLADEQIAPRLRSLQGVSDVTVYGGMERELTVSLDPNRMAAFDVSPETVRDRLSESATDESYGVLQEPGRDLLLLRPAEQRMDVLRRLVLNQPSGSGQPVRLRDVADVTLGPAPVHSISRIDGQSVVTLTLSRARGSHMIEVAEAVQRRLADLRAQLPDDTRILVADDRSEDVRAQLQDLSWRGGLALLLVVLVLIFMLKSLRATAIVLFAVAVSLSVALALMGPLGLTLNLLTIAGLVLVFGLLIDNAVVVVEQLTVQRDRARRSGQVASLHQAARKALKGVWLPLLGGTLSTIVVMLPLVYLSGELRAMFLPFGVLVSLTLTVSLASAALLVPVLGRYLPPSKQKRRRILRLRRFTAATYRVASRFPRLTLSTLALVFGIPIWLLPSMLGEPEEGSQTPAARLTRLYNATIGSENVRAVRNILDPALGGIVRPFVRTADFGRGWAYEPRRFAFVSLRLPAGNTIERADTLMQRFERVALASTIVEKTIVRLSERYATMQVQFTEASLRTAEPYIVREELIQQAVLLAGIDVSVGGLLPEGYSSGIGDGISGFRVEAYGPNYDDLASLSETFAERLKRRSRRVAGINTNVGRHGYEDTREVLRFHWTADSELRSDVAAATIAAHLRPVFATRFPAFYADLEEISRTPVRIIVERDARMDVARLVERPLLLRDSTQVQLASLAAYQVEETPSGIERYNQQYKRYIQVDYRGPFQRGSELIREELDGMPMPPGYRIEFGRFGFFDDDVPRAFGWVIAATILLVFLITAAVFESWRLPLVVMFSVPLALVGVSAGFLFTAASFAEGAFIGCVLLVGIAVNDSILLVDQYRQFCFQHPMRPSALLARLAVRERLRPMWTTTLTSVASMLPLLMFPDSGDFWMGLAIVVTGGLLASTLLSPISTIAVLSFFCGDSPLRDGKSSGEC